MFDGDLVVHSQLVQLLWLYYYTVSSPCTAALSLPFFSPLIFYSFSSGSFFLFPFYLFIYHRPHLLSLPISIPHLSLLPITFPLSIPLSLSSFHLFLSLSSFFSSSSLISVSLPLSLSLADSLPTLCWVSCSLSLSLWD